MIMYVDRQFLKNNVVKNLQIRKIVVPLQRKTEKDRAFSSAGSEHLPYKQRVGGSNPSTPTRRKRDFFNKVPLFFVRNSCLATCYKYESQWGSD